MNQYGNQPNVNIAAVKKILGNGMVPVAIAFVLFAAFCFTTIRIDHVTGEQVGIMLDRFTGEVTVVEESGAKIYNGIRHSFSVLDKTLQTLEMTETHGRGDRSGKDDLKIKTIDGSDVYVDLKVQYRIMPEQGDLVVTSSGLQDNYKQKWARDYARAIVRNFLGELTTEEFYDASKRDAKLVLAQNEINKRLNQFGLNIDSIVIPQRPHFYAEYEEMIKKKKLADQAVLEEQSKALAAKQRQQTLLVQETNRKNVAVEQYEGLMRQKVIEAEADANRIQKDADAYYEKVTINATANLYEQIQLAEGITAKKSAEAEGISEMNKALSAPGGQNMVKLEYARKLQGITITGKPFTFEGHTDRFQHSNAPAAASKGKK
jgi:regulator of protease activity HflC (stomatin/prohibitin superfamily)